MTVPWVILWIAFSMVTGMFASIRRNRSGFGWFVLALFISSLLAFIFYAVLQPKPEQVRLAPTAAVNNALESPNDLASALLYLVGGMAAFAMMIIAMFWAMQH